MKVSTGIFLLATLILLHLTICENQVSAALLITGHHESNSEENLIQDVVEPGVAPYDPSLQIVTVNETEIQPENTDKASCTPSQFWSQRLQKCLKRRGSHWRIPWKSCQTGERWSRRSRNCVPINLNETATVTNALDLIFDGPGLICDEGQGWSTLEEKCVPVPVSTNGPHNCTEGEKWCRHKQKCVRKFRFSPRKYKSSGRFNFSRTCEEGERFSRRGRKCVKINEDSTTSSSTTTTSLGSLEFDQAGLICDKGERWSEQLGMCVFIPNTNESDADDNSTGDDDSDETTTTTERAARFGKSSCGTDERWSRFLRRCVVSKTRSTQTTQSTNQDDADDNSNEDNGETTTEMIFQIGRSSCSTGERWSRFLRRCVKTRAFYSRNEGKFESRCDVGERWSRYTRRCVQIETPKVEIEEQATDLEDVHDVEF